ncbi:MAG TPA: ABC transporter permease [Anaerolineae bacterium]|nr:ABC transporter permease [Anaerolineae bacterium]
MIANLRVVRTTFELDVKQQAVDLFMIFGVLIQPLLIAIMAIYMLLERDASRGIYVVVGSGMTGLWTSLLFRGTFNINAERFMGTLEGIVASPSSLATVVMGKTLASVTMSLLSMIFSYGLASLIFRFPLSVAQPVPFCLSLLITVLAFISFGLLISPLMAINLSLSGWVNALEYPMYILGGFLFPILLLPGWSNPLSYVLAPYWAARVLHATSSGGATLADILLSWTMMLILGGIYVGASYRLFRIVLRRARVDATLSLM